MLRKLFKAFAIAYAAIFGGLFLLVIATNMLISF